MKPIQLEFNSKTSVTNKRALIFVHGNWHGAWCWHEAWLNYFFEQGYDVHTFSFRNHGKSEQVGSMRWLRVEDYTDDLEAIHQKITKPVYFIGHSMGGMVTQKYLERNPINVKGAVLIASIPPHGVWRVTLKSIFRHPLTFLMVNLSMSLKPLIKTPELARELFVGDDFPQNDLIPYWKKLQDESYMGFLDSLFLNLPQPKKVKVPMLVIGGGKDFFFSRKDVDATAKAYSVEAIIYPDAPHNLFMTKGWEGVASLINNWLSID